MSKAQLTSDLLPNPNLCLSLLRCCLFLCVSKSAAGSFSSSASCFVSFTMSLFRSLFGVFVWLSVALYCSLLSLICRLLYCLAPSYVSLRLCLSPCSLSCQLWRSKSSYPYFLFFFFLSFFIYFFLSFLHLSFYSFFLSYLPSSLLISFPRFSLFSVFLLALSLSVFFDIILPVFLDFR